MLKSLLLIVRCRVRESTVPPEVAKLCLLCLMPLMSLMLLMLLMSFKFLVLSCRVCTSSVLPTIAKCLSIPATLLLN